MPRFLANSFLGLNFVVSVQAWYICLNLIDLSKKSTFCLFKTEFKAKKQFARNMGIQFRRVIYRQHSSELIKNLSDMSKSKNFVSFKKITAVT